jgi:GNAT superfamily N-acetyltransferase
VTESTNLIRAASADDILQLQAVEKDAAEAYRAVPGYAFCADLPVRTMSEHGQVQRTGIALVLELEGRPEGFVLILPMDERAHVLEAAVSRSHQRRGFGRRLFAAAEAWARDHGFSEITLTTYRDVPWNAPFYSRLGYSVFRPDGGHRELLALVEDESAAGFTQAPRVAMYKNLRG